MKILVEERISMDMFLRSSTTMNFPCVRIISNNLRILNIQFIGMDSLQMALGLSPRLFLISMQRIPSSRSLQTILFYPSPSSVSKLESLMKNKTCKSINSSCSKHPHLLCTCIILFRSLIDSYALIFFLHFTSSSFNGGGNFVQSPLLFSNFTTKFFPFASQRRKLTRIH